MPPKTSHRWTIDICSRCEKCLEPGGSAEGWCHCEPSDFPEGKRTYRPVEVVPASTLTDTEERLARTEGERNDWRAKANQLTRELRDKPVSEVADALRTRLEDRWATRALSAEQRIERVREWAEGILTQNRQPQSTEQWYHDNALVIAANRVLGFLTQAERSGASNPDSPADQEPSEGGTE